MLTPFHFSFAVPDPDAAKPFYVDVIGCSPGRDHGTWVDVLFFGHQLTIHAGTTAEAGKHLLRDPAGNLLEFKFYHDRSAVPGSKPR